MSGEMGVEDELYQGSLMDLSFNVECILFFEEINKKYRKTKLDSFFSETVRLLKKEQKIFLARHLERWEEDVNVADMRNVFLGLGIFTKDALGIAEQIHKTGVDLTYTEYKFLNNLPSWRGKHLTKRQSEFLMSIYKKAIL